MVKVTKLGSSRNKIWIQTYVFFISKMLQSSLHSVTLFFSTGKVNCFTYIFGKAHLEKRKNILPTRKEKERQLKEALTGEEVSGNGVWVQCHEQANARHVENKKLAFRSSSCHHTLFPDQSSMALVFCSEILFKYAGFYVKMPWYINIRIKIVRGIILSVTSCTNSSSDYLI